MTAEKHIAADKNALKSYDGNEQIGMHHNIKQKKNWKMVLTISKVAQVILIVCQRLHSSRECGPSQVATNKAGKNRQGAGTIAECTLGMHMLPTLLARSLEEHVAI